MSFFWFLVSVVLLILLMRARDGTKEASDTSYARGYWDGYRAFGDKVKGLLRTPVVSKYELEQLIKEGENDYVPAPMAQQAVDASQRPVSVERDDIQDFEEIDYDELPTPVHSNIAAQVTEPAVSAAVAQPQLSPEQQALEKERVTLRNLNTLLYMGSFLLVAAAAAFIAAAMPESVRLIGLILVVIVFYTAGIVLYKTVPRLRPAAIAFAGTGLAILPFVGVALTILGGVSETVAWFTVSAIGLVAYGYASVVLQSQVVSYLTMAFVLSLASSAVATATLPVVWYFIVLIGVSLAASSISYLWPKLLPSVFHEPVEATGQIVTPVAMIASVFAANSMTIAMYEVLFAIGTAHYLVVWLQRRQLMYETIVRALAHLTLLIVGWDIFVSTPPKASFTLYGVWWCGLLFVQFAYSLWRIQTLSRDRRNAETAWFVIVQIGYVASLGFWISSAHAALLVSVNLLVLSAVSLAIALRLRQPGWGYVGMLASWFVPFVLGQMAAVPAWPWWTMVGIYVVLASAALLGYKWTKDHGRSALLRYFFVVALVAYIFGIVLSGLLSRDMTVLGWSLFFTSAISIIASYVTGQKIAELAGACAGVAAVAAWLSLASLGVWYGSTVVAMSTAGLLLASALHQLAGGQTERRDGMLAVAILVFAGFVLNNFASDDHVVIVGMLALFAGTVATFNARWMLGTHTTNPIHTQLLTVGYLLYLFFAWCLSWQLDLGWQVALYSLATFVLWSSSHIERIKPMLLVGQLALFLAIFKAWQWLELNSTWTLTATLWITAGACYLAYWVYASRTDEWRRLASIGSTLVALVVVAVVGLGGTGTIELDVAAAVSLIAASIVAGVHGYLVRNATIIEASVYVATLGAQRIVGLLAPEVNLVVYTHWWALTVALVAYWRGSDKTARLAVAMGLVSASVGLYALTQGGMYQLLFLVEHIILLAAGALLRKQWAIWWGIAASVIAILYFIKDYTFLWLALLGLGLIALVVWRLSKVGKK